VSDATAGSQDALVRPWVGKLHHSRNLSDDWGFIRDSDGYLVMCLRMPRLDQEELNRHRRDGTDPTQPVVDYLLSVLNAPNAVRSTTPNTEDNHGS
jgi:hypothetical protein